MNTTKIEGPVVLSGDEASSTIRQLTKRIEQLERQVAFEIERSAERVVEAVPVVIKFGQAWNLGNAPLPQAAIEQFRAAIDGDNGRW